jgi:hemolysin activation/secretion protein
MRARLRLACASSLAAFAVLALPLAARASFDPSDPPAGEHTGSDGPRYWVGHVHLSYANEHPLQPPISLLVDASYALGKASDGYVGARRGGNNVWFHLSELGAAEPVPLYATGLQDLCEQIVDELASRGMMGVYVAPAPSDIDAETGGDVRPEGNTDLHLVVHTGRVQAVRTFRAPAIAAAQPVEVSNDHEAIAADSPLQPVGAGDPLDKKKLDSYLANLNRLPGRLVDVVVTPTLTPGVVNLDYLVQEDRPWTLSSDFSNTGTDSTGKDRQHFGFADYQLTGSDDVLLLDYLTSGFSNTNAANGSYEARLPYLGGLRWRLGGNWSEYNSDQFGVTHIDVTDPNATDPNAPPKTKTSVEKLQFGGTQWEVNGTLVENLYAEPGFFVDAFGGGRFMDVSVVNLTDFKADMPFFIPVLGVNLDRSWPTAHLRGNMTFQQSVPEFAGSTAADLAKFSAIGRSDIDSSWHILSVDFGGSIYLQPWFHGTRFFSPRPLRPREMVHELVYRIGGQTSLGTRLIPQVEAVLGGAATVRGYPQSISSGDSAFNGSLEYRYHIPLGLKTLDPVQVPWLGTFRLSPDAALRLPDWDLVFAIFSDFGRVYNQSKVIGEHNDSLASLGFGTELILRRNVSLRFDYGFAMLDVPSADVSRGDGEAHFYALVRY